MSVIQHSYYKEIDDSFRMHRKRAEKCLENGPQYDRLEAIAHALIALANMADLMEFRRYNADDIADGETTTDQDDASETVDGE